MTIKTLIVDDERLARQRLRRLLGQHAEVEIVGECADGATALAAVRESMPDLLLLDIQMPGLDGFGVVEELGAAPRPIIVFVTAFDQHALRAFDACALDYLLKPASPERLARVIGRVQAQLRDAPAARAAEPALGSAEGRRFQVRCGQRTSFVLPEEIDWIEADGNYAVLHVGGQRHFLRATMSALEAELPETFARTSRSSIINLRRVRELQSTGSHHFAIMQSEARVPLTCGIRELQQRLRAL